jgi:hypothetical protein
MSIVLIVQIVAACCLLFEAFKLFAGPNRPVWGWLGMALWLISLMVSGISIHATGGP